MGPRARAGDRPGSGAALRPDQSHRVDDRSPRVAGAALLARARAGHDGRAGGQALRVRHAPQRAADPYLDTLTGKDLTRKWKREPSGETPGTKLHRTTYHYWFHLGESQAVRQLLGHTRLPTFVGGFGKSQYRPEGLAPHTGRSKPCSRV